MNWWAIVTLVGGYVVGFISDIGKDYFKEILADQKHERKAADRFSRIRQAMPSVKFLKILMRCARRATARCALMEDMKSGGHVPHESDSAVTKSFVCNVGYE